MQLSSISDIELLESKVREAVGLRSDKLIIKTIVDISNEIPTNVNAISASHAEYLAGRFLQGMVLCGDLVAIAVRYEMRMDTLRKAEYSAAMLTRARAAGFTKLGEQKEYANTDAKYLETDDNFCDAKAFRIMLAQKHQAFEKAHHHMRKIAEQHADGLGEIKNLSRVNSSIEDNDWEAAIR